MCTSQLHSFLQHQCNITYWIWCWHFCLVFVDFKSSSACKCIHLWCLCLDDKSVSFFTRFLSTTNEKRNPHITSPFFTLKRPDYSFMYSFLLERLVEPSVSRFVNLSFKTFAVLYLSLLSLFVVLLTSFLLPILTTFVCFCS